MPLFENSRDFTINGGNFTSISRKRGIEFLLEHVAPGAFHNSRERYDHPKCHPNTRVAVIQAIIDWIEDGQKVSFIKWLNGPAGSGKTAIAQEMAELCHQKGYLAASFFWSRNAAGRNDEERLVTSLAYQLLIAIPEIRGHVEEAVENNPAFFALSLEAQMALLVIEPLQKIFGSGQRVRLNFQGPNVIILDGLDECGTPDAQQYILRVISNSINQFPIPLVFLIASRPEQAIRHSFDNQPLLEITSRLVLDEKYHPDDDIQLFLVESFESVKTTHKLRSLLPRFWPTYEDIRMLVHKSSGQFIYARTVVKYVASPRRKPHDQLKIILGITPSGPDAPFAELDALYRQIFEAVEDLPKVLEVLSSFFLIKKLFRFKRSIAGHIERILSYNSGDLQLILADLHSVMHVPDIADDDELEDHEGNEDEDDLRVFHASLEDFLIDPDRALDLYLDKGQAYARLTRRYLQYINCFYENTGKRSNDETIWELYLLSNLKDFYCHASPTPELFADFFAFDFLSWTTILIHGTTGDSWNSAKPYMILVDLYIWLKDQETIVPSCFGPEKCLSIDLCPSFGCALDSLCKHWYKVWEEKGNSDIARNVSALITHPQFSYHLKGQSLEAVHIVTGCYFDENQAYYMRNDNQLDPLRKYFLDPERAGRYLVTDAMYTRLSLCIFAVILKELDSSRVEEDGGDNNDEDELEALWQSCVNDISEFCIHQRILEFCIKILPFFLLKAPYRLTLDKLARTLFRCKTEYAEYIFNILQPEMELLHDAINLYLNRRPPAINSPQEQHHASTTESQLPEESIDTCIPDLYQRVDSQKRQRSTSVNSAVGVIRWPDWLL